MSLIRKCWFRWVDRELDREVQLPERESLESADWNQLIGETGERLSGKYIWRTGGKVLYRNFRPKGGGEVDIVFRDGDVLVFAEVKTRTTEAFGAPSRAVDAEKQRLIIRGANAWLRELNLPEVTFRFDIFEVILSDGEVPEIRVIEGAFEAGQAGLGV